ncbi:hypothetical protein PS858_03386 [Pseudomonas fluorescens]|uniref:Uncharacterized protein n=1 Tax=Pseudomonas fluorescens TaxID=294 RepID=A0A5E7LH21_PSEFL|nr:hypothetical protein PS704_04431 [Pseudomonas fluorescens]VVP12596.1 hypothetical protein PS858_03386 [Pseudomonas fluorescens]
MARLIPSPASQFLQGDNINLVGAGLPAMLLGRHRLWACSTNHPINSRNFGEGAGFSGKTR